MRSHTGLVSLLLLLSAAVFDPIVLAVACEVGSAGAPGSQVGTVSCQLDFSQCLVSAFHVFVTDSCDDPGLNPEYNPCVTTACQSGVCQVGLPIPNGTPCDDNYSTSAPKPNGACTSSFLRTVAGYPNYNNCLVTSGETESLDCPPNHKCLCFLGSDPVPCMPGGGQCVCNDGCGVSCFDACLNGVCNATTFVRAEPGPVSLTSDTSVEWPATADAAHWNSYRGTIPATTLGSRPAGAVYDHACFESADAFGDGPTLSTDGSVPPSRTAYYYLVSGEGDGCESELGRDSSGGPIRSSVLCPTPP